MLLLSDPTLVLEVKCNPTLLLSQIYCISFEVLDRVWLEMRASYMDFPSVMQRVRSQLHAALGSQPRSLEGLKALLTP